MSDLEIKAHSLTLEYLRQAKISSAIQPAALAVEYKKAFKIILDELKKPSPL